MPTAFSGSSPNLRGTGSSLYGHAYHIWIGKISCFWRPFCRCWSVIEVENSRQTDWLSTPCSKTLGLYKMTILRRKIYFEYLKISKIRNPVSALIFSHNFWKGNGDITYLWFVYCHRSSLYVKLIPAWLVCENSDLLNDTVRARSEPILTLWTFVGPMCVQGVP